jgi:ureidoglycolate amidohydrolase
VTNLQVKVDIDRLSAELTELARFTDAEPPAVTRVLYTESDLKARAFVKRLCAEAGLAVREDPIGNMFARWPGSEQERPAVATGSHVDAIPNAGQYDGTVGVLGGLEALRALKRAGFQPVRSLELLVFTSEEPTRFGVGCVGSRALAGMLTAEALALLRDGDGHTLDDLRQRAGFHGALSEVRLPAGFYAAFVELHIEQGPLLEREGIPIGVVTAIAAPAALRVHLEGEGGHAGAVLMPERRDALCGAAEIVLAVEAAARTSGSADTVATTGVCRVHPGAINSIPDRVTLDIDIRDIELASRDGAVASVCEAVDETARRRGLRARVEVLNADPPANRSDAVINAAQAACQQLGAAYRLMPSRAYHDSLFMARICPTGMIFIPCKNGVSHRPDEYSAPDDIRRGVEVLALTLAQLSQDALGV